MKWFLGILFSLFSLFPLGAFADPEYKEGVIQSISVLSDTTVYTIQDKKTQNIITIKEPHAIFRGNEKRFFENDSVIYTAQTQEGEMIYLLNDHSRIPSLVWWVLAFLATTLFFTKGKSLGALVGLVLSGLILIFGVLPSIKNGYDPLLVCFLASILISLVSLYASHGFRKSTTIALVAVWITVGLCFLLSLFAMYSVHLFGFGDETASLLAMNGEFFDFRGILLGGIILGTIGIVDDVISTQIESLQQIFESSPSISSVALWNRGMAIGNEHIFSMINTLMLVYFSASLCGMLLLTAANAEVSMLINSEMFAEEVMRTIIGSFGIVFAVPISTSIGVWWIAKK